MFLDTSGLLCFFDDGDSRHLNAHNSIKSSNALLTTSYVLAEFIPLCEVRGLRRKKTLKFTESIMHNPLVEIVWVDKVLHKQGFSLLQSRLDKTYSLCDAISFVVMNLMHIDEALTTDKHFQQEGFTKLLES